MDLILPEDNPKRLLGFWRAQRLARGERTIIKDCHRIKARALEMLVAGLLPKPNLMILEPPRMGKTDLGVKAFQAWALSLVPDCEFINASYAQPLAVANTQYIRETLTSEWYRNLICSDFGATVELRGEKASGRSDFFTTLEGGVVKAIGTGGGITGFGAGKLRPSFGGAILIDDPIKAQDKDSPVERQSVIDWYHGTLESRRNRKEDPMTPIILDMQRLHPQDLAGHLLATERHRWNVVQIPAINEKGESIWPERISLKELAHMRVYDKETYDAQFMQNPSTEGYLLLDSNWWGFYTDRKEIERHITLKIITADTAFKDKDASDYSVFQLWGFINTYGAVLLDQVRGKWIFPDMIKQAKDFLFKHARNLPPGITPAKEAWVEDKASGTPLVQTLQREGLPFKEWLPPNADQQIYDKSQRLSAPGRDKQARVKQCTMPISMGRILLPWPALQGYGWVEHFVQECSAFTADDSHLHDDQVDAMTTALLIWQQRGGGVGQVPAIKGSKSWKDWEQHIFNETMKAA